jgi:hypothetical protein
MSEREAVSRRSALRTGIAAVAGCVAAAGARANDEDAEPPKLSKERVHYQWTPNAAGSHCSICANFIAPSSCHIVAGPISGGGYCLVFSPEDIDLNKLP